MVIFFYRPPDDITILVNLLKNHFIKQKLKNISQMWKRSKGRRFIIVSYAINVFLFGVAIGIVCCQYNLIKLKYEVDPIAFIGILVTVFLGLYITDKISRQNEAGRIEKDIIIKYLTELGEKYLELFNYCKNGKAQQDQIIPLTDSIATKVSYVKKLLNTCEFNASSIDIDSLIKEERKFRDLLTGGAALNGSFIYDSNKIIDIEQTYQSITELNTQLMIAVNRV